MVGKHPAATDEGSDGPERARKNARINTTMEAELPPTDSPRHSVPPQLREHAAQMLADALADRTSATQAPLDVAQRAAGELVEFVTNCATKESSARAVNAAVHTEAQLLARGIRKSADVVRHLELPSSDGSMEQTLTLCRELLSQLDRNSNTIRFHHATLRQRAAAAGVEEASAAWSEAMRDTGALQDYASAALTTGEAKWVQNGFKWCGDECDRFYRRGGLRQALLKAQRVEFFAAHGRPMDDAEAAAAATAADVPLAAFKDRPLRLLDVGSNHNPFQHHHEQFQVCALDLCPIDSSVYRSDFLELQVGDSGSQLQADDASASSSCRGDLVRLPRGHYDVVLMSLVLSYLPHPLLRTRMVLKARQLLADSHGLLILITPHSTDGVAGKGKPARQLTEWRRAVEALGFAQCRYERLHSVHALSFRTTTTCNMPEDSELIPMPIAFDDPNKVTKPRLNGVVPLPQALRPPPSA